MQHGTFWGHITLSSGATQRYELQAPCRQAAARMAIAMHPGARCASARSTDPTTAGIHAERILGDLAVRMSGFPLIGGGVAA